jgi:hypothetical protein
MEVTYLIECRTGPSDQWTPWLKYKLEKIALKTLEQVKEGTWFIDKTYKANKYEYRIVEVSE